MKKSFYVLTIMFFMMACVPEDHVLEIEIVNNTTEPVKDIYLSTAGDRISFKADNLPAGEDIAHTMEVKKALADGQYTFRFTRSTGEQETATGSYLDDEEGALKKTLVFNIQEEDVNVEQKVLEVK
jgi:hypothetical protein